MKKINLRPWQEVVGTVDGFETYKEITVIRILSSRQFNLAIPMHELKECDVNLEKLVGQRISLLRTNNGYLLEMNSQTDDSQSTVPER
jgi:hypothetical protein